MSGSSAEPLSIDGLANARDLGGLRTRDGRLVLSRQVIRSDNLKGLTERGQDELSAVVGPAIVIDLRMHLEVDHEGYAIAHDPARIVNLPMVPQAGVTSEQLDAGAAGTLLEDYLRQIEVNAGSIVEALRLISEPANRPLVVHCTAGKDRTGLVVALLLDILGVDHEVIVADYHATQANMGPILDRVRSSAVYQRNGLAEAPLRIFAAEPETMRGFLAELGVRYGSAEQWALAKGLDAADIERLRATLLA